MTKSAHIILTEISNTVKTVAIEVSEKTKLVIDASKADVIKIMLSIIIAAGLSYWLNGLLSQYDNSADTQSDNNFVRGELQQQNNPDIGELSCDDIQNNNRCSDGTFELGF